MITEKHHAQSGYHKDDVLTIGVFGRLLNEVLDKKIDEKFALVHARIEALESKMMEGFEAVFSNFERLERRIDDLVIRKADREELLALHTRMVRLEKTA